MSGVNSHLHVMSHNDVMMRIRMMRLLQLLLLLLRDTPPDAMQTDIMERTH